MFFNSEQLCRGPRCDKNKEKQAFSSYLCTPPQTNTMLPYLFISGSAGLSLRAGSQEFSPATTSLGPSYFDTEQKYWKEKNASNYKS